MSNMFAGKLTFRTVDRKGNEDDTTGQIWLLLKKDAINCASALFQFL